MKKNLLIAMMFVMSMNVFAQATFTINSTESTQKDSTMTIRLYNAGNSSVKINSKLQSGQPLYVIDGKVANQKPDGTDTKVFTNIKAEDIAKIMVLKGENATKTYGEAGKDGVIVITTKKGESTEKLSGEISSNITIKLPDSTSKSTGTTFAIKDKDGSMPKNLCYYVGDTKVAKIDDIDPNNIESVSVMKGEKAKAYNSDCPDGVVIITLKKK
jgi:bla regulator protein blaR1